MQDGSCVFCRIIDGEEMVSLVHEDERAVAFLDTSPMSPGHTLVVSREHYPTLLDMPEDVAAHCIVVAQRIASGVRRATGAQAINLFSANGRAGGQDVPHFHLHLIPVREGERFVLDFPVEPDRVPMRSELDVMAARIGRAIQQNGLIASPSA